MLNHQELKNVYIAVYIISWYKKNQILVSVLVCFWKPGVENKRRY